MSESLIQMQRKLADITEKLEKTEEGLADLLNQLSIILGGEMVFDPPDHLVAAIPETWDDWDKSIYKKYLRETANSWGRRKMIRQARALLQSATQPGSEPVAHHPV